MRTIIALVSAAALGAAMLPGTASAAPRHHRAVQHVAYADQPVYADRAYAAEPVYAAAPSSLEPFIYPIGGAVIGAIIGAAVCPPCAIAGSTLTSGGGALIGAGIGAVGGTVVGVAATQPRYTRF